jgi:predicted Rossmann fold flavoprotein
MTNANDHHYNVIVIGAGAAGLMAASTAGKNGRKTMVIEHTDKIGEKIRISGGGRCNFTNLNASPKNYLSQNPYFCISALNQYTQHNFIDLVKKHGITYHEKTLGQLFCDISSKQIINMMVKECKDANVELLLECKVTNIEKSDRFALTTSKGNLTCESLIIATGGLSIPKLGATSFGYEIAKKFGHKIIPTKAALVPLKVGKDDLKFYESLSGVSVPSIVSTGNTSFKENILFTHRGLSGPAILQISSYIPNTSKGSISINLLPEFNMENEFQKAKNTKMILPNFLKNYLPNRFVENWCKESKPINELKMKYLQDIAQTLHNFKVNIAGDEGYLKAEVTAGGVDTNDLSSKTMESKKVAGLYFIGEVVDVTGWLGGYNFQWAWSSGYVAGSNA